MILQIPFNFECPIFLFDTCISFNDKKLAQIFKQRVARSEVKKLIKQFRHLRKTGLVTVAGKPNDDLAPGTQNSVFKQAGLKK